MVDKAPQWCKEAESKVRLNVGWVQKVPVHEGLCVHVHRVAEMRHNSILQELERPKVLGRALKEEVAKRDRHLRQWVVPLIGCLRKHRAEDAEERRVFVLLGILLLLVQKVGLKKCANSMTFP